LVPRLYPPPLGGQLLHAAKPGYDYRQNKFQSVVRTANGHTHYIWRESDKVTPFPTRWWYSINR
jgi:hypothetical protein